MPIGCGERPRRIQRSRGGGSPGRSPGRCVLLFPKMAAATRKSGGLRRFAQFRRSRAACPNLIQRHNRRRHPLDFETAPLPPTPRSAAASPGRCLRGIFCDRVAARAVRVPHARAADEPVTLNFVNADIDAVIKAVAEITGPQFHRRSEGQGHDQHHLRPPGAAEPRLPDAALGAAPAGLHRDRGRRRGQDRARSRREAAGRRGRDRPVGARRRPAGHAGDHAQIRIGGAARQRAASADHAEQHDRRLSRTATRW